jgi:hypothetical protein
MESLNLSFDPTTEAWKQKVLPLYVMGGMFVMMSIFVGQIVYHDHVRKSLLRDLKSLGPEYTVKLNGRTVDEPKTIVSALSHTAQSAFVVRSDKKPPIKVEIADGKKTVRATIVPDADTANEYWIKLSVESNEVGHVVDAKLTRYLTKEGFDVTP